MTDLNTSTEVTINDETAIGFIPCYVAALFVQSDGCYDSIGIDVWDINRDARLYEP